MAGSSNFSPTRRSFLVLAAQAAAAVLAWRAATVGRWFRDTGAGSPALASLRNLSTEVGRKYLLAHPDEADASYLLTTLGASLESHTERSRRVRADFRRGDVVRIDGWVLSRNEARLSALAHVGW